MTTQGTATRHSGKPIPYAYRDCFQRAWAEDPPEIRLPAQQLRELSPLLTGSRGLPLLGDRISRMENLSPQLKRRISEHCLRMALQSAQQELIINLLFSSLREAGIEPVLIKGWSVARYYAHPLTRNSLDVDLVVSADKLSQAQEIISGLNLPYGSVDLHGGFPDLADRGWEAVFQRTRLVENHGLPIRVLGEEDQFRLVCLHFWRHRLNRPMWLCDIGALLEGASTEFDWDLCFAGKTRDVQRIQAAAALACRLLGARLKTSWGEQAVAKLPAWLQRAVLNSWMQRPEQQGEEDERTFRFITSTLFNPHDPIRTVNRLPIGPYHSELTIRWLTRLMTPLVIAVRVARDMTAPLKSGRRGTVAVHRKISK